MLKKTKIPVQVKITDAKQTKIQGQVAGNVSDKVTPKKKIKDMTCEERKEYNRMKQRARRESLDKEAFRVTMARDKANQRSKERNANEKRF